MPPPELRVGACASITHFFPLPNAHRRKAGEAGSIRPPVPRMRAVILHAVALVTEQSRLAELFRPENLMAPDLRYYAAACQTDLANPRNRDGIARQTDHMLAMIDRA